MAQVPHVDVAGVGLFRVRRWAQDAIFAALLVGGTLASTALWTLGVFVLLLGWLGAFTADGVALQLGNLVDRYRAADALRQTAFQGQLLRLGLGIFAVLLVMRLPFLWRRIGRERRSSHG